MELKVVCGTWIKEDDEKVLTVLQESDKWLFLEELSVRTGLSAGRVKHTLSLLGQQRKRYDSRKKSSEL